MWQNRNQLVQDFVPIKVALARKCLAVALRTFFNITGWNVELPLDDSTVMTRHLISVPIITLIPVSNSSPSLSGCNIMRQLLRSLDFLGPPRNRQITPAITKDAVLHTTVVVSCFIFSAW